MANRKSIVGESCPLRIKRVRSLIDRLLARFFDFWSDDFRTIINGSTEKNWGVKAGLFHVDEILQSIDNFIVAVGLIFQIIAFKIGVYHEHKQ